MQILEELLGEHRLIEEVAGSLVTFARQVGQKPEKLTHLKQFWHFFTELNDRYHYEKEEILFHGFILAGIAEDNVPVRFLRQEHDETRNYLAQLASLSEKNRLTDSETSELVKISEALCESIWMHIDKEDSVVFREADDRIRGRNKNEMHQMLADFTARNPQIAEIKSLGQTLVSQFTPIEELPGLVRSDGCMSCRHFGDGCSGIEHEWWSETEWEDFKKKGESD